MTRFERDYGCLAGLAIGDALGMPTEFLSRNEIISEFGWVDGFRAAPTWHPHHRLSPGQVTDDTGQALAVLHAYQPEGCLIAEDVSRELIAWAELAGEDLRLIAGPSTLLALQELRAGADPRQTGREGKTNGAAYRAVGIGLVNAGRPKLAMDQVVEACLPTHGTCVAISGAAAVAAAVAAAMDEGANVARILAAAKSGAVAGRAYGTWAWGTPLEKRIELAERIVNCAAEDHQALAALGEYVGTDLLVAESIATAFGLVQLSEGDPMKAVIFGANIGGDTDTIAAIAGAICGAYRGVQAIDRDMLAEVERVNSLDLAGEARRVEDICRKLESGSGGQ